MREVDGSGALLPDQALAQHYAEIIQVAAYLEAEWSDFLLGKDVLRQDDQKFAPVSPTFYVEVAQKIVAWVAAAGLQVRHACDVGGATGRLVYELARNIDRIDSVTLVEPAPALAHWARRLLLDGEPIDDFPVVHTRRRTGVGAPARVPTRPANVRIRVVEQGVDDLDRELKFDLVCCLNVIDRVARPASLVQTLASHICPGGILVLASPLSFDQRFTPDRADWVDDLEALLPPARWRIVGRADVLYELRRHERERISYLSQVVAAVLR
jgi:SAM-dependent methyltransferase